MGSPQMVQSPDSAYTCTKMLLIFVPGDANINYRGCLREQPDKIVIQPFRWLNTFLDWKSFVVTSNSIYSVSHFHDLLHVSIPSTRFIMSQVQDERTLWQTVTAQVFLVGDGRPCLTVTVVPSVIEHLTLGHGHRKPVKYPHGNIEWRLFSKL